MVEKEIKVIDDSKLYEMLGKWKELIKGKEEK